MYIIQIADLHIGSAEKCIEEEREILSKGITKIKQNIPENQKLLICVLGDIIDSKKISTRKRKIAKARYEEAADLFRLMLKELREQYDVKIQFCLGNHDVTHISEFLDFAKEFDSAITKEKIEDGYFMEGDGIYYVFLNSCKGGQYKYGSIDYKKLEQILNDISAEKPKIFVMHHTVISMYEKDNSSIRDSARLIRLLKENNVLGVLHGHIHGRERFIIGQCRMIGTGALFSRNNSNVNSQFNIIKVGAFAFREISTYIYMADDRISGSSWCKINTEELSYENYFGGNNFQEVYQKLMKRLADTPVINNVVLQISCTYKEFDANLKNFLDNDKFTIGRKNYSYFELAELWEDIKVPQCLYFNHGMYFKVQDKEQGDIEVHGIQFIARQLKSKPTSNRAVLTTYNMDTVSKVLNGEEYLPSLLSVQFSQSKDGSILYVHMYLRALEAERFLKINICEIKWLLERLQEQNVLFSRVDVAISAFRVQKRKNFNCFMKADIDNIDEEKLKLCVYGGNIAEICRMLTEKNDASETITNVAGIKALCDVMKKSNEEIASCEYSLITISKLDKVLEIYKELDNLHQRGSINTEEESQCEKEISERINDVIIELKKAGGQ